MLCLQVLLHLGVVVRGDNLLRDKTRLFRAEALGSVLALLLKRLALIVLAAFGRNNCQ